MLSSSISCCSSASRRYGCASFWIGIVGCHPLKKEEHNAIVHMLYVLFVEKLQHMG